MGAAATTVDRILTAGGIDGRDTVDLDKDWEAVDRILADYTPTSAVFPGAAPGAEDLGLEVHHADAATTGRIVDALTGITDDRLVATFDRNAPSIAQLYPYNLGADLDEGRDSIIERSQELADLYRSAAAAGHGVLGVLS